MAEMCYISGQDLNKQVKLTYPRVLYLKARSCTQRACEVRKWIAFGSILEIKINQQSGKHLDRNKHRILSRCWKPVRCPSNLAIGPARPPLPARLYEDPKLKDMGRMEEHEMRSVTPWAKRPGDFVGIQKPSDCGCSVGCSGATILCGVCASV